MELITEGQQCEVHPAADMFPRMAAQEFEDLKADIRDKGVLEPVWVDEEGRLLDGRHRVRACQELGFDTPCRVFGGDDPIAFVLSLNLDRRHLNESQCAMVAERLANLHQGDNQHTEEVGSVDSTSLTSAANRLHFSQTSVRRTRRLRECGITELVAGVETGTYVWGRLGPSRSFPRQSSRRWWKRGPRP